MEIVNRKRLLDLANNLDRLLTKLENSAEDGLKAAVIYAEETDSETARDTFALGWYSSLIECTVRDGRALVTAALKYDGRERNAGPDPQTL